jgi:hypothetical protein
MPKATKLTSTMILCLRNIRDYNFHAATGFHGMSERGGAYQSVMALRRRGLVEGPHRKENLTEEGAKVLEEIEDAKEGQRNAGMTNMVRRVLREAGMTEAGWSSHWGYKAEPGTTRGVVHIRYVRHPDVTQIQATVKYGNERISEYIRALQAGGYTAARVPGVTNVDNLIVMRAGR